MFWIDFETKSNCDLKVKGAYNYAQDASTDVLCMAYAEDDADVQLWLPGQPFPKLRGQIRAHNASFERLIFWYVLQQNIPLENFYCTAAQARANCMPGSLEDVGRAATSKMRKDHRGAALIRQLCIPPFNNNPKLLQEFYDYCMQDVRAMRDISKSLRELSPEELADYHVNERINDRGVLVDLKLCDAAVGYSDAEVIDIQQIVREITNGEVTSVRSPKMRQWVIDRVGPEARKMMIVDGKDSIDKTVRANLLAMGEDEVPPDVADVIQCADDLWASSVAKFKRLSELSDEEDHRVRGAFVFNGGAATGRASSYGAQVHNFTRKCAKEPEKVRQAMVRGHEIVPQFGLRITDVLKGMLRPALIPAPGNVLVVADWSAIEGRVHPWLSNCPAGERKLDLFRQGLDPYIVNASALFGVDYAEVTADQRQVGKVQELACFAPETQVLTDSGYKGIQAVLLTDKLWDGHSWVSHQGVVLRGVKTVINLCGVRVTPDHRILCGASWREAKQLVSNRQFLTLALARGSASLPFSVLNTSDKARAMYAYCASNATAALRRTWSTFITCCAGSLRDAMSAQKRKLAIGEKHTTSTLTLAPTTITVDDCSIAYPLARIGAITRKHASTPVTEGGGYFYTRRGYLTKQRFLGMLSRWMVGTTPNWSLTESTTIKGTSRATCVSQLKNSTTGTAEPFLKCSEESLSLSPVFDILNAGPKNRFTIRTDAGHLIVHNCGFLGGKGSFTKFAPGTPDAEANKAISVWRRTNPWAMEHGKELEAAYMRAMRNPGHEFSAGRVTYVKHGEHLWYMLPSGRVLCYPYARFEADGVSYLKSAFKPKQDAKEWPRARLWRGLACENVTQATANDLLRNAMRSIPDVVLHCHDEIAVECPAAEGENVCSLVRQVMCMPPAWAAGLPLAIEVKIMERYGK